MRKSLTQYRRHGAEGYAKWIAQVNNLSIIPTGTNNHAIHSDAKRMIEGTFNPNYIASDDNPFAEIIQEYDSWTVKELKAECIKRGLPVYGTKAELALRLKQNDVSIPTGTDESDAPTEVAAEETSVAPSQEDAATTGEEIDDESAENNNGQEPNIEK